MGKRTQIRPTALAAAMLATATLVTAAALTACSGTPSTPETPLPSGAAAASASAATVEPDTPEKILARSEAALLAAKSFQTKSTATLGGITLVTESVQIGDDARGTQTVEGLKTEFIRIGKDLYINGSEAYWFNKVSLDSLGRVIYQWVKVDATSPAHAPLASPFDRSKPLSGAESGTLSRAGTATVAGQEALVIKSASGATIYVAAVGEPYPLRVEATASMDQGTANAVVEFSGFNTVTTIIAPPDGPVIVFTTS